MRRLIAEFWWLWEKAVEHADAKVELQLVGPFRMVGLTGEDHTPKGRKSCALLAMLALAPEYKRPRKWIQDKLWSDRANEQGAASLRQCLAEIRRALGPGRECLKSDNYLISLDQHRISIDLETNPALCAKARSGDLELLEGLDIRDPEFEDWLRDQRQRFHDLVYGDRAEKVSERAVADGPEHQDTESQYKLLLTRGVVGDSVESSVLADALLDIIAKTISELGSAEIIDRRTIPEGEGLPALADGTLALHSDIAKTNGKQILRVILSKYPEKRVLWSDAVQNGRRTALNINDPDLLRRINQVVNVAVDRLVNLPSDSTPVVLATSLCHAGIQHLFRLGQQNFEAADRFFAQAYDVEPRGIYLAWRAFLRMFLLAERQYTSREAVELESSEFASRALQLDPHNSFVASLNAHVFLTVKRSYAAAYELAERSIQLNRANPLGWACLGMAKCHLGRAREGFQHTQLARNIAGTSPYGFQLNGLCCIAGSVAGEFEQAMRFGEASHALSPTFAPPLRFLTALYIHAGKHDLSHKVVSKLKVLEPDFSYEMLVERSYPAASLHRTPLLKSLPVRQI